MGADHIVASGCLVPVLPLLKAQLRKSETKSATAAKPTAAAKPGLRSSASRSGETPLAALVAFCEKVNKSAKKEKCKRLLNAADGYLDEIAGVGAAVLTQCKVPVRIKYKAEGHFANGTGFEVTLSTAAEAEAAVRARKPKCTLKKVTEVYSGDGGLSPLLCYEFVHPDCDYDDFWPEQQLYFRVEKASLWSSSGKPKQALKTLCDRLGLAPNALAPVTWVSILY